MRKKLLKIFIFAFLINFFYEVLHSPLYETCRNLPLEKYVPRITRASLNDAAIILIYYLVLSKIFKTKNPFKDKRFMLFFFFISITFSYLWEIYAINNGLWEYSGKMPLIFGAGITPIFQIVITGLVTLTFVFI